MVKAYTHKQAALLLSYLQEGSSLLDFGCGDLSLARAIKTARPRLKVTAVDVVDAGVRDPHITFQVYNGRRLPFGSGTFDTTIVYHVFHHCDDPQMALADVMRVTKKQILVVEPVYRHPLDLFFMKILDRMTNGWRTAAIPMPFTFQKEETWRRWAKEKGWTVSQVKPAGVFPDWLPVGVTKLFVMRRHAGQKAK